MSAFERELREMIREVLCEELERMLARQQSAAEYVSTSTAARIADVTPHTIRRWIREGKIVAHGDGKRLRLRRADIDALLASERRQSEQIGDLTPEQMAARDFG